MHVKSGMKFACNSIHPVCHHRDSKLCCSSCLYATDSRLTLNNLHCFTGLSIFPSPSLQVHVVPRFSRRANVQDSPFLQRSLH